MCQGAAAPLETPKKGTTEAWTTERYGSRSGLRRGRFRLSLPAEGSRRYVWSAGQRGRGTFCESVITHYDTFCLPVEFSKVPWARALRLWTPGRRCRPAPGFETGSHASRGVASCFVKMMRGGAFCCQRHRETRVWTWGCGACEHQRTSEDEAAQM